MKRSLLCVILAIILFAGLFLIIGKQFTSAPSDSSAPAAEAAPDDTSAYMGSGSIAYASGVDALNSSQEALLKSYLDTWYTSLGQLQEVTFSELLSDDSEALYAASALSFQVEIRASEELDYSLISYAYTLTCQSVTTNPDGSVSIRASEDSTQHFAAYPDVDAQRFDAIHLFVLEQSGDTWRIRSQALPDTLFSLLYTGDSMEIPEFSDPDAVQETKALYVTQMPEYLAEYRALRSGYLSESESIPLSDANHNYDSAAALAYATKYINTRNDHWRDYSELGGNCQNFASQCLYAGGIPMDTTGDEVWKWYGDEPSNGNGAFGRSQSWTGVDSFLAYAASNTGSGLVALTDAPFASGEAGDLLHLGTANDGFLHATVIAQPIKNAEGRTVDYLVYSNTSNLRNFPASLSGFTACTVTRIIGWND